MGRFTNLDFNDSAATPLDPELDPWPNHDGPACLAEGDVLFNKGAYEAALTSYSRALRHDRQMVSAWAGQIRCLLRLGELPEARTWSDRALDKFSNHPELLAAKGVALVLDGDRLQGQEFLDGAVQERNPPVWAWIHRAEGLLLLDHPVGNAERCLLKAQEMLPNDAGMWLQCGIVWNKSKHPARARKALLEALRLDARNPQILYQCGLAHEQLGEKAAASGYFERAIAERPGYKAAREALERTRRRSLFGFLRR
jgi:Flp pilus assembly protein TadD